MGIGNSTVASALTAALTGRRAADVVGPGTGVEGDRLVHKRAIVECAVRRIAAEDDPFEVLRQVGGLELAGLAGVVLGAARASRAVVTDGFIATAAALAAARLCPAARDYLFASHRSAEPGHRVLLEALALRPLVDLDLRLGEGTGAVLCLPMLDAAGAILREMATFASARVSGRTEEPPHA
jgi:nicotinate-nucleotide--dimethylbenzimidazole phosphoribosyltransferase